MDDLKSFIKKYLPRLREAGITKETDEEKVYRSLSAFANDICTAVGESLEGVCEATLLDYLLICVESYEAFQIDGEGLTCEMYLELMEELSKGEVKFENITTHIDAATEESGIGEGTIRFSFNGKPYEFTFKVHYEWFDYNFIAFMNKVLEENGISERMIIFGFDQALLIYRKPEWADKLKELLPGIDVDID